MPPRRARPVRGQSRWAARLAVLSTVALLLCLVVSGTGRALFAFLWACMALAAVVLEFAARRRRAGTPQPPQPTPRVRPRDARRRALRDDQPPSRR